MWDVWLLNWWCAQLELNFLLASLSSAASSVTASCSKEAALTSGPGGSDCASMCVQRGRPAKTAFLSPPPLVEEGCSTVYFNLPGTVRDSVRVPQVVFGDGKNPFEVLIVRVRAGYGPTTAVITLRPVDILHGYPA